MDMDHTMDMDMGSSMTMTATSTGGMSSSTSSSMGGMDMGGMGGMSMDMGTGSCKVSHFIANPVIDNQQMLWNWNTIDACFLSQSWHITSRGMFAGSCIGVICLVLCLEFLRRVGREYDAFIIRRAKLRYQYLSSENSSASASLLQTQNGNGSDSDQQQQQQQQDQNKTTTTTATTNATTATTKTKPPPTPFDNGDQLIIRPTIVEQFVRATLHLFQFAVAYFIMLLAMYFNGYIIICIFIGAFLGAFIFSWEGLVVNKKEYVLPCTPSIEWDIDANWVIGMMLRL